MSLPNLLVAEKAHLAQLLEAVQRCVYFLDAAASGLPWPLDGEALALRKKDRELFGALAAFNERFAKLQDTLAAAMRHAHLLQGESADSFLKVLAWYEKQGATVAVQGFGNVGSIAAQLMQEEGMKVVAVSDKSGGIYNPKGLDVNDCLAWVKEHKFLAGYPKGKPVTNEELLALPCDVLVPAALENVITSKNAGDIKAKIICEGANGPTTAKADAILDAKGIYVIPDILANAGGVTVSYFEWVQDRGGYFWDEATVNERLEKIMVKAFDEVAAMAAAHDVSMRIGAYMLSIDRVASMHRMRGLYA